MSAQRGMCVHYQGVRYTDGHNPCAAGVDYYAAFGPRPGIACRAPCIQEIKRHDGGAPRWEPWPRRGETEIQCDKRRMPTAEEIAQADAEAEAALEGVRKDAERMDFMQKQLHAVDLCYGGAQESALIFKWPPIPVGADLRKNIDAALQEQQK